MLAGRVQSINTASLASWAVACSERMLHAQRDGVEVTRCDATLQQTDVEEFDGGNEVLISTLPFLTSFDDGG